MYIYNSSKNALVAGEVEQAASWWTRFIGLMGRKALAPGQGLVIVPCQSIHTCFMRFPIDVLFLDRDGRVVGLAKEMRPYRFSRWFRKARYVVELPAGSIGASGTEVGDEMLLGEAGAVI